MADGGVQSRPKGLSERDGRRNETRRDVVTVLQTAGVVKESRVESGPRTGAGDAVVRVRLMR